MAVFAPDNRMIAIVAGSRWERDKEYVWRALDWFDANTHISFVAEGGQRFVDEETGEIVGGVDHWAREWALARGRMTRSWPANWDAYGRAAGPIRNAQMAKESHAQVALLFPGGPGTASMRREAQKRGIRIVDMPSK